MVDVAADEEVAAIRPCAAGDRGRANAASVDAKIAKRVGDAATVHVQRAGAVVADVEAEAIPRAAGDRSRANTTDAAAEIAIAVGDSAAVHVERAGAAVADVEGTSPGANLKPPPRHVGLHVQRDCVCDTRRAGQVQRACIRQRERARTQDRATDREGTRLVELECAVNRDVA